MPKKELKLSHDSVGFAFLSDSHSVSTISFVLFQLHLGLGKKLELNSYRKDNGDIACCGMLCQSVKSFPLMM